MRNPACTGLDGCPSGPPGTRLCGAQGLLLFFAVAIAKDPPASRGSHRRRSPGARVDLFVSLRYACSTTFDQEVDQNKVQCLLIGVSPRVVGPFRTPGYHEACRTSLDSPPAAAPYRPATQSATALHSETRQADASSVRSSNGATSSSCRTKRCKGQCVCLRGDNDLPSGCVCRAQAASECLPDMVAKLDVYHAFGIHETHHPNSPKPSGSEGCWSCWSCSMSATIIASRSLSSAPCGREVGISLVGHDDITIGALSQQRVKTIARSRDDLHQLLALLRICGLAEQTADLTDNLVGKPRSCRPDAEGDGRVRAPSIAAPDC